VFCTLHPESVEALFTEALRLNMRLIAGKVMMDRHTPDYLSEDAKQSYRQTRELIQRWHRPGTVGVCHYPAFCTDVFTRAARGGEFTQGGVSGYLDADPSERKPE
jgi:Cytosine deaminase and related metal-dependent hydrolases